MSERIKNMNPNNFQLFLIGQGNNKTKDPALRKNAPIEEILRFNKEKKNEKNPTKKSPVKVNQLKNDKVNTSIISNSSFTSKVSAASSTFEDIENEPIDHDQNVKLSSEPNESDEQLLKNDQENYQIIPMMDGIIISEQKNAKTRISNNKTESDWINSIFKNKKLDNPKEKIEKNGKWLDVGDLRRAVFLVNQSITSKLLIRYDEFKSLDKDDWVGDSIIDAYCFLLQARYPNHHYFLVQYTSYLSEYIGLKTEIDWGDRSVLQYMINPIKQLWISQKINIFDNKEILFFPVSYPNGQHYGSVAVYLEQNEIHYNDTYLACGDDADRLSIMKNILKLLQKIKEYYKTENLISNKDLKEENFNFIIQNNIPQQKGGTECGVLTTIIIDLLSSNLKEKKDFGILKKVSELRMFIATGLKRGVILYGEEKNLQQYQRYSTKEMFERVFMDCKEIMNVNKILSLIDSKEDPVPFELKLDNTIKEIENDDEQELNDNTIELTHNDEEINDIFSTEEQINDNNGVINFSTMHYRKNIENYIPIQFKNFINSFIFHKNHEDKEMTLRDKIYSPLTIRLRNIVRLKGPIWLDDEVMDCYLFLLSLKHSKYFFFITLFYSKLADEQYEFDYNFTQVVRWFYREEKRIVNLFEKKKLFMTMNYPTQSHWEFIYADMDDLTLYFHDSYLSLTSSNEKHKAMKIFLKFLKKLYSLIYPNENDEIHTKWQNFEIKTESNDNKGWKLVIPNDPQQVGGVDCGVYTLMKIEVLSEGLSVEEIIHDDIRSYRLLIAFNLLKGEISYPLSHFDEVLLEQEIRTDIFNNITKKKTSPFSQIISHSNVNNVTRKVIEIVEHNNKIEAPAQDNNQNNQNQAIDLVELNSSFEIDDNKDNERMDITSSFLKDEKENILQIVFHKSDINDKLLASSFVYTNKIDINGELENDDNQIILVNDLEFNKIDQSDLSYDFGKDADFYFSGIEAIEITREAIDKVESHLEESIKVRSLRGIYLTVLNIMNKSEINSDDSEENRNNYEGKMKNLFEEQSNTLKIKYNQRKKQFVKNSKLGHNLLRNTLKKIESNFVLVNKLFVACIETKNSTEIPGIEQYVLENENIFNNNIIIHKNENIKNYIQSIKGYSSTIKKTISSFLKEKSSIMFYIDNIIALFTYICKKNNYFPNFNPITTKNKKDKNIALPDQQRSERNRSAVVEYSNQQQLSGKKKLKIKKTKSIGGVERKENVVAASKSGKPKDTSVARSTVIGNKRKEEEIKNNNVKFIDEKLVTSAEISDSKLLEEMLLKIQISEEAKLSCSRDLNYLFNNPTFFINKDIKLVFEFLKIVAEEYPLDIFKKKKEFYAAKCTTKIMTFFINNPIEKNGKQVSKALQNWFMRLKYDFEFFTVERKAFLQSLVHRFSDADEDPQNILCTPQEIPIELFYKAFFDYIYHIFERQLEKRRSDFFFFNDETNIKNLIQLSEDLKRWIDEPDKNFFDVLNEDFLIILDDYNWFSKDRLTLLCDIWNLQDIHDGIIAIMLEEKINNDLGKYKLEIILKYPQFISMLTFCTSFSKYIDRIFMFGFEDVFIQSVPKLILYNFFVDLKKHINQSFVEKNKSDILLQSTLLNWLISVEKGKDKLLIDEFWKETNNKQMYEDYKSMFDLLNANYENSIVLSPWSGQDYNRFVFTAFLEDLSNNLVLHKENILFKKVNFIEFIYSIFKVYNTTKNELQMNSKYYAIYEWLCNLNEDIKNDEELIISPISNNNNSFNNKILTPIIRTTNKVNSEVISSLFQKFSTATKREKVFNLEDDVDNSFLTNDSGSCSKEVTELIDTPDVDKLNKTSDVAEILIGMNEKMISGYDAGNDEDQDELTLNLESDDDIGEKQLKDLIKNLRQNKSLKFRRVLIINKVEKNNSTNNNYNNYNYNQLSNTALGKRRSSSPIHNEKEVKHKKFSDVVEDINEVLTTFEEDATVEELEKLREMITNKIEERRKIV